MLFPLIFVISNLSPKFTLIFTCDFVLFFILMKFGSGSFEQSTQPVLKPKNQLLLS